MLGVARSVPDAVVIQGLTKRYGELVAVDGLDLRIPTGVCFGLLGPNGAGKTTTIRILQGQVPVTAGSVHVLGHDMATQARVAKARMGVVPQETNLDPDFTVRHNLLVYARYFRIARRRAEAKADELLRFLQLEEKRDSGILELSGGMKRRLIVARALVNDPELIVLDEPTTGLDPQARHTIWDKIRQLRAQGKTILLTTHYMDEAERLCDELVVIDHGRILSRGAPRELIEKHTQGEAAELVLGHEAVDQVAALAQHLKEAGVPHESLSDRVVAFGNGLDEVARDAAARFPVRETVRRRATLEDVFLRLTGRALRD